MTGLNSQYMLAPSLQEYFVDKTTGLPLANGKVYFYKDNSRSSFKTVYELIDGGSENYSYAALSNPVTLGATGTPVDADGNDIVIYYFPYDSDVNVELYYVVVKDSLGVVQFTRSAWPNLVTATMATTNLENFIPNGQFVQHNTIFSSTSPTGGTITADNTAIAPGGWYYMRSTGATDSDFVQFPRFNNYVGSPDQSPRYAVNVSCTSATNATSKYLAIRFNDVNKFSSDMQNYTFAFFGKSSGADSVQILTRKYFGTGGSPSSTVTTNIGTLNLTTGYPSTAYVFSFTFGANTSYVIGTNNDDYIEVIISFPINASFNATFTDFALVLDTQTTVSFPVTTRSQFNYGSMLAELSPGYTNTKLYLPIMMTPTGFDFDTSVVGLISPTLKSTAPKAYLLCDGTTYLYSKSSTDLIPYSRLGDHLFNGTNYPFGGGIDYVSATVGVTTNTGNVFVSSNKPGTTGSSAAPADGTTTGLTYLTTFAAQTSSYAVRANYISGGGLNIRGDVIGSVAAVAAGTSGFAVSDIRNSSVVNHYFSVTPLAAAGLGGLYFTFSNTTTNYYVWFQVNGVGADPAPGGTGIKVNLSTSDGVANVSVKIAAVLNGGYGTTITCPVANSINNNSYLTFGTVLYPFYVWFNKDSLGTDPAVSGKTGIEVDVTSGQTAAQVATALSVAINKAAFQTPDYRGMILRGVDTAQLWDAGARSFMPGIPLPIISTNQPGYFEIDANLQHNHAAATTTTTTTTTSTTVSLNVGGTMGGQNGGGGTANSFLTASVASVNVPISSNPTYTGASTSNSTSNSTTTNTAAGNSQSNPVNSAVNWLIRY